MVARGAGAAGPVILACRQWDPLGLARRLPSPGAGAWRYAPLLPWQVQCPGRVCAALAAGSGELGPVPGVVSSLFPPARPAFPALCVAGRPLWVSLILARWYAIPCGLCVPRARSGCPSGFPRLSLVCVCARALAASAPPPLPGLVSHAHLARSQCWALVGPFHSVRAPPRVRPRSRGPFGLLGGGRPGPVSPYLAWGCAPPLGWVRAWGPVTNPTARALASWPCALAWRAVGAARGRPGGCLLPGCGAPGPRRSPTPDHSSFQACGRGPLPTGCGCGRCGRGDPSPTPQRALLQAGFVRCGGGMKVPGGGASCLGVGLLGTGALPPPTSRPLGRQAGAHYPVAVNAGAAGVGTCQQPHSARSCELALRAVGAA